MALPELPGKTLLDIEDAARSVWKKYGAKIPVSPEDIAAGENISLHYDFFGDAFEGALDHDAGEFMILMDKGSARKSPQRSRFTMAHELGHYFLQHHSDALAKGQIPRSNAANGHLGKLLAESEADHFAACLLVPDDALRPALAKTDPWTEAIRKFSETFVVSVQCAAIRCMQLAGIPCATIMLPSQAQKPPWLAVSAGMQKWGVTRESKLKPPAWYQSGFAKTCCLGDWIETTSENSAGKAVYQDSKRLGRHGDLVLLYADECRDWGV